MNLQEAKELQDSVNQAVNQTGDWRVALETAESIAGKLVENLSDDDPINQNYYWDLMREYVSDTDAGIELVFPYGHDTARIISEKDGGVIAYVHKDNALRFVNALRMAG